MPHRVIATEKDLADFVALLGNVKLPVTVEWVQGRDRTKDQNALMWLWATEAANQLGDRTADEVQRTWKLNFGLPILCEDSDEYRSFCTLTLKRLTYEERVEAMRFTPVTSEMKVRQMVRFLDTVQRECLQNGVRLTGPDPELASYQRQYREKAAA
jgi:hypothetical protein